MLTTHNSFFPSIRQNSTLISLSCKMLYNRSLPGWLQTFWLSTLLKLSFFLSDLNNNFLQCTTLLALQPTLLATLALFLMNTLPSPTKSLHFLNPAAITFVNFAVSAHISTLKQPAFKIATFIVHSKLDYCNSVYHNLPNYQLNWLEQIQNSLVRAVVKAPKSSHITPILKSLHWLKVNERIKYKLLSLTYKVLTTSQPSYLNNLISVQTPRSTRSSSVVTLSRPPTISSLKITDRSFWYASPRLCNQLPDSFRQFHQSCLDSPPHSFVSSFLSSPPLSSSITSSLFHSKLKVKSTFSTNPSHLRLLLPRCSGPVGRVSDS